MDHYAKAYPIFSRMRGIEEAKTMLKSLKRFAKDEVVQERLRIIEFYDTHGEKKQQERHLELVGIRSGYGRSG